MHSYVDKKIYSCKKWVLQVVSHVFDVNTHRVKTMELIHLKQADSVEEYKL
jgi:hypothetical protein